MKSYYYHSRLTIGWRMFNHIENSSSHIHNFDECIYHHIIIERVYTDAKIVTARLHNLKENSKNRNQMFYYHYYILYFTLTQQVFVIL